MTQRMFYNLEIKARREMANVDYTDRQWIDEKHDVGLRIVLDSTMLTHGAEAKAIIVDQLLKVLDTYYSENP